MLTHVILTEDILSLDLSIQEKFLIALSKMPQGCFLSNQQIASYLNLSKSRVSHLITKLSKLGYVSVKLEYRTNSKEVAKRIFTFKKAIAKVQEVTKQFLGGKNKQLKQDLKQQSYDTVQQTVGTAKVQQYTFTDNQYYKKQQQAFHHVQSHNWDYEELDRLAQEHLERCVYGGDTNEKGSIVSG